MLQNTIMRILTGLPRDTPTSVLLEQTGSLSVHQSTAFQTLVLAKKIVNSGKPTYLAEQLNSQNYAKHMLRGQNVNMDLQDYRLNSSRAGFLY